MLICLALLAGCGRPSRPSPPRAAVPPAPPTPTVYNPGLEPVLGPKVHAVPGVTRSRMLYYRQRGVTNVSVAGSWGWTRKHPMERRGETWGLDITELGIGLGRHEFKFLPDGEWEEGDNRMLFLNEEGVLEQPQDLIFAARMDRCDRIDIFLRRALPDPDSVSVRLLPDTPIRSVKWDTGSDGRELLGYAMAGDHATFCLAESTYGLRLDESDRCTVAGSFNGWNGSHEDWELKRNDATRRWEGAFVLASKTGGSLPEFKFVVNGSRWLDPPLMAPNARSDGKGHVNLTVDPTLSVGPVIYVETQEPLDLSEGHSVVIDGDDMSPAIAIVTPGDALDAIKSDRELGAILDRTRKRTGFRLFAPRATEVSLCLYDGPEFQDPEDGFLEPRETFVMKRYASEGVWEVWLEGLRIGSYYSFRVDGAQGNGDGFNRDVPIGDPYCLAVAHERGNSIVIDPSAGREWFKGWTDEQWETPPWSDAVIYETHVRDLTSHHSSGVPEDLRGSYAGLLASDGTGTGLDHLKALGVNMIEFMPIHEFENAGTNHGWGYSPVYFFAPESSYAQKPLVGSHYYEFKNLVNELHNKGFGVLLDVVYNHVGGPNIYAMIDNKYYFRMDHEFRYSNFSGCGNDVRSEGPMVRRLLIDSVLYWMTEYHIDGFRFDLAELIDLDTLMAIRDAARKVNPNVLLISEPWSFRGNHKMALKGQGWAAWNDEFRNPVRDFVLGHGKRDSVKAAIRGSVDSFAATPIQSVNYLESHDDMCLADELTADPNKDGRNLTPKDARRHRLGATMLFTSLGIPMISEGQEYIRSKRGIHNTYNKGDVINQLRWDERKRPEAAVTLRYYRDLIALRQSDAGRSLRWSHTVPDGYVSWIEPDSKRALGYAINSDGKLPGARFVVLANGGGQSTDFKMRVPAAGWRQIGNGKQIDVKGIADKDGARRTFGAGTYRVKVPAQTAYVFIGK